MNKNAIMQLVIPLALAVLVGLGLQVTTEDLTAAVGAGITLVALIYGVYQRNQKTNAQSNTQGVIDFYDPESPVEVPPVPVPARTWKMNEETKRWVLIGHDALNQSSLLNQISVAEIERKTHYFLSFADRGGGFYEIEFGLMRGSGVGEPPKPGTST